MTPPSPNHNPLSRFSVIIPVYNHAQTVADVVRKAKKLGFPTWVVDDGSTDATYDNLKNIADIQVLRHSKNRGKGAALITGMSEAAKTARWSITLDADGQHNPDDAYHLIDAIPKNKRPLVIGCRKGMDDVRVPWTSRFGRLFSNFWVKASGGPVVADSQSGFRVYPLPESLDLNVTSRRYQFEVEFLVKANWRHWPVVEAPITVSYHPGRPRISHFHPWIDFFRNAAVFSRLIIYRIFTFKFLSDRY